jgi:hypothetical protein
MLFKPSPLPVINRMFNAPQSGLPFILSIIFLSSLPSEFLSEPTLHLSSFLVSSPFLLYIILFVIALFRYGFGSYAVVEDNLLTISEISVFGLGKRRITSIDLLDTKKIIKKKEVQRFSRGGQFIFFFLIFELKDNTQKTISLRTWDSDSFISLCDFLQEKFPAIQFEEDLAKRKLKNFRL